MTSRPLRQQHGIHYHHNGRAAGLADLTMGPGNPKLVLTDFFLKEKKCSFLSASWVWLLIRPPIICNVNIAEGTEKDTEMKMSELLTWFSV